jgi:uncharacterized protein YigE (DUF2233 family)
MVYGIIQLRNLLLPVAWVCIVCLGLTGCAQEPVRDTGQVAPVPTLMPTHPITPVAPTAPPALTGAQPSDSGWITAGPGVDLRRLRLAHGERLAPVSIVRVDPALMRFRVGYAPAAPRPLATWHADANALATINGGFFDENHQSTALVISDGLVSGSSYQGSGGMFAVDAAGNVSLRYLAAQPYDPNEPLVAALQSWPMLITDGTLTYTTADDGQRARRSVVALDRSGRVLLIACSGNDFSLRGLADWLLASDLEIDAALNLDGGSSTGLYLDSAEEDLRIPAFVPLPITLMVVPG